MNAALGHAGVTLAFLAAVVGATTVGYGLMRGKQTLSRQAPTYGWLILGGAVLAVFAMERALFTHDFSINFVAHNNSRETPTLFTIAGMWAALEGSILLWGLILSIYIATMLRHFRKRRDDAMVGWATVVTYVVAAFFFGLMLSPADPFKAVVGLIPADGTGPNPLLQDHVLMAFHPPILYAGYVGFTIPFAFGIAALITGRLGEGWLVEVRRWTLIAWGLLSVGIVLGSWWSYEVLGWAGYWAWDPVENASLLPWLTATAYLHSVMVQERRGMLRIWNLSLLSATFSLTVLGTFLTRSGVLDSVHAFTESPLGPWLIGAFAAVVVVSCGLIFWRGDKLGSPGSIASPLSREAAFLANNILFAAFAFVVLLGTVFPLLAEAVNGDRISVGRPFFDGMTRPIGMLLLFLMAVAPALPWRGGTTETLKQRLQWPTAFAVAAMIGCVAFGIRGVWVVTGFGLGAFVGGCAVRHIALQVRRQGLWGLVGRTSGGMIAHLGIAIIAVALVASQSYGQRGEFELQPGQSASISGHTITFVQLRQIQHKNRSSTVAELRVDNGKTFSPALSKFPNSTDAIGTPSVKSTITEDIYLTLVRTPINPGDATVISAVVQPLVSWLWFGGFVIGLGTVLALVSSRPRKVRVRTREETIDLVERERETVLS